MRTRFVTAQRTGTAVWAPMRTLEGGRARANAVAAHAAVSAMPRTVSSKIRVALPARETWRLRCDFVLEQHIASLNRRKLHFLEEEVIREGAEDEQRCRLARCDLLGDHLNGGAMGVKTSDLGSEIHFVYFVNLFGEAHGGEFSVDLALRRLNVSITGHQWCLVESDHSCFLCTRIQLGVNLPGIGRLVEMQLERQMRASHEAFPEHAYAYRSKRCVVAPTAPVAQRPSELVGVLPTLAERNEEEEGGGGEGGGSGDCRGNEHGHDGLAGAQAQPVAARGRGAPALGDAPAPTAPRAAGHRAGARAPAARARAAAVRVRGRGGGRLERDRGVKNNPF